MDIVNRKLIEKHLINFRKFLVSNGAQLLEPTNSYEVCRFIAGDETSIIYSKLNGKITFTGQSHAAWKAFKTSSSWRAMPSTKRKRSVNATIRTLMKRDNNTCFYCLLPVDEESASEEHLLSLTHGGTDHIANKVLAHQKCNYMAGHLSLFEKIRIHVHVQLARQAKRLGK